MGIIFTPATGTLELFEYSGTSGTTVTVQYESPAPSGGGSGSEGSATESVLSSVAINNVRYGESSSIPEDLVIEFVEGENSFTFSSVFDDMFYRTIKYLLYDEDNLDLDPNYNVKTYLEAHRFRDVPEICTGVYEFIPSPVQHRLIPFTIDYTATITTTTTDPETSISSSTSSEETGTATWTFMISEDWEVVIQKLLNVINNGTRYKFAKSNYPELR